MFQYTFRDIDVACWNVAFCPSYSGDFLWLKIIQTANGIHMCVVHICFCRFQSDRSECVSNKHVCSKTALCENRRPLQRTSNKMLHLRTNYTGLVPSLLLLAWNLKMIKYLIWHHEMEVAPHDLRWTFNDWRPKPNWTFCEIGENLRQRYIQMATSKLR